jgi:hypothetical protein
VAFVELMIMYQSESCNWDVQYVLDTPSLKSCRNR